MSGMISTTRRLVALGQLLSVLVLSLIAAGCGQKLLASPVKVQKGAWTIVLHDIRSGPNSFGNAVVTYVPGPGHRFLWAHLHLTNETKQDRRFSWSACDLDDGNDAILPGVVAVDTALVNPRQMNEIIEAKDTVNRKVAFSYPYDRLPTRLKCKEMVFPLDL